MASGTVRSAAGGSGDRPRGQATELALAATLWTYLFLLIVTLVIGRSIGAALFLSRFDGLGLSLIYMLMGICVPVIVLSVEYLGRGAGTLQIAVCTQAFIFSGSVALAIVFPYFAELPAGLPHGVIYLFIESLAFLTTVQFWANTNSIFSLKQAHRYYAFIGSGGICGSIAGGWWVRHLARGSLNEAIWMIPCLIPIIIALSGVLAWLHWIHRSQYAKNKNRWNVDRAAHLVELSPAIASGARLVRPNQAPPLSLHVAFGCVAMLTVVATTLIDYYYKTYADVSFSGNPQKLTAFFGGFYLCVGVCTLLTQIIFTTAIFRHRSAFWGLFVSPVLLLVMTVVNVLAPGLWTVAAFKLSDSALAHSINRSCQEMLYTPLPTRWVRTLKANTEGLWGRGGLLLAGILLFIFSRYTGVDSTRWLLAAIIIVLACWGLSIELLRYVYRTISAEQMNSIPVPAAIHWNDLQADEDRREVA